MTVPPRSDGPRQTVTSASTPQIINASQAALVRDSTMAAAQLPKPQILIAQLIRDRATRLRHISRGIPAAARCAMKLRLPNVPPGARLSVANSILKPYACASAVSAPTTTAVAINAARTPPSPRAARRQADQKTTAVLNEIVNARMAAK